jgi:Matrixin
VIILAFGSQTTYAQNRLAGRFGEIIVGNQRVVVDVTIAALPGQNQNDISENALRGQGARPLQPSELTINGLAWDQFLQNYNGAGAPIAAFTSLTNSEATWNGVSTSAFYVASETTTRCPSLVKECPGPQTFDGYNDVGWAAISGCCTLAVTWYGTSIDEADMALNSGLQWTANGVAGYDLETMMLHENGHALGLGHSDVSGSVMGAYVLCGSAAHPPD